MRMLYLNTVCRFCAGVLLVGLLLLSASPAGAQLVPKAASGAGTPPVPTVGAKNANPDLEYVISPDDLLDVYIMDVPELSRQYRVSPDGSVTLPLVQGPLPAAGLTIAAFSHLAAEELRSGKLVTNPHISVTVVQSRLHGVAITGAVKKPQIYPVFAKTSLLDVLSQAEGLDDSAGSFAIVWRGDLAARVLNLDSRKGMTPDEIEAARTSTVNVRQLLGSGDARANIDIYPGDRITVPRAGIIYVVGAVHRPGGYPMRPSKQGMTVLQAIALAEDMKATARQQDAVIIRSDAQSPDGRKQVPVNLKQVFAGKAADQALQADDILFVPDSSSKRALHRGLEAILQTATGVVIYRNR